MKISLWQQFSSNHSGSFTVVGTFPTPEAANAAAAKLREIVQTIAEWHEQHPGDSTKPTPPEVEFARQYGVKWDVAVDWYDEMATINVLDEPVVVFEASETWSSPQPLLNILKQLGGSVVYSAVADEPFADFRVKLTCTAPDEDTASSIAARILAYLSEPRAQRTPWYREDLMDYELVAQGTLRQLGKGLAFDLQFSSSQKGLSALIDYLKAQGCEGIEYQFVQGMEIKF